MLAARFSALAISSMSCKLGPTNSASLVALVTLAGRTVRFFAPGALGRLSPTILSLNWIIFCFFPGGPNVANLLVSSRITCVLISPSAPALVRFLVRLTVMVCAGSVSLVAVTAAGLSFVVMLLVTAIFEARSLQVLVVLNYGAVDWKTNINGKS